MRRKAITVQRDGVRIKCKRVKVPGDGACLFSALSFLMFQNISMAAMIRSSVVAHVVKNWERFRLETVNQYLVPYPSVLRYETEMSNPRTYGSNCELKAASEIYSYRFQLFSISNGKLIADFTPPKTIRGIRRLGFCGDYSNGHFDVLIPVDEYDSWHFDENSLLSTKPQKPSAGTGKESRKNSTGNQKEKKVKDVDKKPNKSPAKPWGLAGLLFNDHIRKEGENTHGYYLRQRNA